MIEAKVNLDWSPEQISGWILRHRLIKASHEWSYRQILADKWMRGTLYRQLSCQEKRRKCYGDYSQCSRLPNRVSIEQRPAIVVQGKHLGDWEVDTIVGKGHYQAIVILINRKSCFALLRKVRQRNADKVSYAMIDLLQTVVNHMYTVIADNGQELADHEKVARGLNVDFFFPIPIQYGREVRRKIGMVLSANMFPRHAISHLLMKGKENRLWLV